MNKDPALLAVMLNLVQDAIGGMNALNTHRSLQLLGGANYLRAFSQEQLATIAESAVGSVCGRADLLRRAVRSGLFHL